MKFSYSLLKKIVPGIPPAKTFADALNTRAFEVESVTGDTLDIKLPANRYSDAGSHWGIAREASAIYGLPWKVKAPVLVNLPEKKGMLAVAVRDEELCPRYAARYFELATIPETPAWMKKALESCGIRPINGVVDLMNYVMIETGQPLHAFDADRVKKNAHGAHELIVRQARAGEHIETLDRERVALDPSILIITDAERPLAIAGIKGGLHAAVTKNTRRIIVEAANFEGPSTFTSSRTLKLATDAASHFSHQISPVLVMQGLDRATELLSESGAILKDSMDSYPRPMSAEVIGLSTARYAACIGNEITPAKAKKHLTALGFEILPSKKAVYEFLTRVPLVRMDIASEEDVMEEIARLEGYDRLEARPPQIALQPVREDDIVTLKDTIRSIAASLGLDEVYNSSFVSEKNLSRAETFEGHGLSSCAVSLENPISEELSLLRPSLVSGFEKNVADNRRFFETVRVFEVGNVFSKKESGVIERTHLMIGLAGKEKTLVRELKGIAEEVLHEAGLVDLFMHTDGQALRLESDHHVIGRMRPMSFEKGWSGAYLEVDLDALLPLLEGEKEYRALPRYPAVMRDISLLASQEVRIGDMLQAMQEASGPLLENVDLIDEYNDPKLGGKASYTFRLVFQSPERTLTDREVNEAMERITARLHSLFRVEVR